jgi:poly-gamma-glutamate system protein
LSGRFPILGGLVLLAVLCFWPAPAEAVTPGEARRAEDLWIEGCRLIREARYGSRPLPAQDLSASGLLGNEDGELTTSLGKLESKQSTLQSGWVHVVADLVNQAGVARGDTVGITLTGSFPALDMAVLLVLESAGIHWIGVSSFGASSWGANTEDASWPWMEGRLVEGGLLSHGSRWQTPGGGSDRFASQTLDQIILLERLMCLFPGSVHPGSMEQAVELRRHAFGRIKAYINVGGGHAAIGTNGFGRLARPGLLDGSDRLLAAGLEKGRGVPGLLQHYLVAGIPVIQLMDIGDLADRYGLPVPARELRSPPVTLPTPAVKRAAPSRRTVTPDEAGDSR